MGSELLSLVLKDPWASVNKALQDHKAMTVRREKTGHKDSMDLRVSARLGFKAMTDLKVLLGLLE